MIWQVQIPWVEIGIGCQPAGIGDGDDTFHELDPVGSLKRVKHPIDMNERDCRDFGDHRLSDCSRERFAFLASDCTEPSDDLAEEMGDLPFGIPPGVDEPSLSDAEFDERQPEETSLNAGVGP